MMGNTFAPIRDTTRNPAAKWLPHVFFGALIALFVLTFALRMQSWLNHDTSWYLVATAKFLHGARLYVDIIEVNPPLPFYATVPPVAMAELLGANATTAFIIYMFLLAMLSLWLSWRLVQRLNSLSRAQIYWFILASAVVFLVLPKFDFGQREHMATMFVWPYVVLTAIRLQGGQCRPAMAILVGFLAGIGFGLKPYFVLVPVALEGLLLVQRRKPGLLLRPENISMALFLLAYLASILLLTPEYVRHIVPMARTVYNTAFQASWHAVLLKGFAPVLLVFVWWQISRMHATRGIHELSSTLAMAGMAFIAVYLMQRKGWSYHQLPATSLLFVALALTLLPLLKAARGKAEYLVRVGLVLGVVILAAIIVQAVKLYHYTSVYPFSRIMKQSGQFDEGISSFYFLSTRLAHAFPLVNRLGLEWTSRSPSLWLLPGVVIARAEMRQDPNSHDKAAVDMVETYQRNAVIEDLLRHKPDLVAVDTSNPLDRMKGHSFAFLPYFMQDPRFAAFWKNYEKVGKLDMKEWPVEFYRRKDRPRPPRKP